MELFAKVPATVNTNNPESSILYPVVRTRGSSGEYQANERAGVARLRWRVSGR